MHTRIGRWEVCSKGYRFFIVKNLHSAQGVWAGGWVGSIPPFPHRLLKVIKTSLLIDIELWSSTTRTYVLHYVRFTVNIYLKLK